MEMEKVIQKGEKREDAGVGVGVGGHSVDSGGGPHRVEERIFQPRFGFTGQWKRRRVSKFSKKGVQLD